MLEVPLAKLIILLVEDNAAVREALSDTLQFLGYQVYEAGGGTEALDLLPQIREPIGLVISDLVMPDMNALELHEALKWVPYTGKLLIITGYPMPYAGLTIVQKPGVRWTRKPISVGELAHLVGIMVEE